MKTKQKSTLIFIGILLAFILIFFAFNRFYVEYLWFSEMGYLDVFFKEVVTKAQLGIPAFIIVFIFINLYLRLLSSALSKTTGLAKNNAKAVRIAKFIGITFASIVIANGIATGLWNVWLKFCNATPFNRVDPLFGKDLSFYFFKLPFWENIQGIAVTLFVFLAILTIFYTAYTLYRAQDPVDTPKELGDATKKGLKKLIELGSKELGVIGCIFLLLLAWGTYLRIFQLVYAGTGMVYGAGATDINIGLKVTIASVVVMIIAAISTLMAGFAKKKRYFFIPHLVLFVLIFGGAGVRAAYEYIAVVPNQYTVEKTYIEKNINSTRESYDLDKAIVKEFAPNQQITAKDIEENSATIGNIPINDQSPTKDMYNSLQGIRNYYRFYDVDIDRYTLDDTYTQVFLGTREMDKNSLPDDAKTWVNQSLKYTHGFGVAVSPVNKTNNVGQPQLLMKDIPPTSETKGLSIKEPRVYFGEGDYDYAIVNGKNPEFDYPEGDNNKENFYAGTGGIKLNLLNRLSFALYFGSSEMLLSSEITSDSKILIKRNILNRVETIAPFFEYDTDPYITIVDGRQYWIIDAFVTSNAYPYAKPYDEKTGKNYIKNSVKVVVDAYNGNVDFYKVSDEPLVDTYQHIFPGLIKNISEMPDGLKSHIRYSKRLFDIQADIYKTYHMTNPQVFYNLEDQWETANQFFGQSKEKVAVASSYIIMKLPERNTEFMLMSTFTPRNKDNMIAWMAGVCDGKDYGQLLVYQFPKQNLVYGPMQIEQRIDQNTVISPQLTLLGQQGSRVLRGNMMTIPIENAILYIEPIYIQASNDGNNLPEVKKVVVSYQNDIVMADSLKEGLSQIFDGVEVDDKPAQSTPLPGSTADLKTLAQKANTLMTEAEEAQKNGDWATYGKKLAELKTTLIELEKFSK